MEGTSYSDSIFTAHDLPGVMVDWSLLQKHNGAILTVIMANDLVMGELQQRLELYV
ncbi:hypothetical protein D3C73_1454630 [compost metagenome]